MLTERVGVGEGKVEASGVLADGRRSVGDVARAEKIGVADGDRTGNAVGAGIAAHDRESAGLVFLDGDIDDDAVRRRAGLRGDFHGLEIAELLQPPLAAVHERAIVSVALHEIEFAPDYVVAGFVVAVNVDALDVKPLIVDDGVDEIDNPNPALPRVRGRVGWGNAFAARQGDGERRAAFGEAHGDVLDGLVDGAGVVNLAGLGAQRGTQARRVDRLYV